MRSRRIFLAVVSAVAWLLEPEPARAARPLDTEDTGTAEPGQAELELSADFLSSAGVRHAGLNGVLSLGVVPRLEARIESAVLLLEPEGLPARAGAGDSLLGIKYRLLDETHVWPAWLASVTLRLPTGDEHRGLGAGDVDVGLLLAVGKSLGPVTLTLNGGYVFVVGDRRLDVWGVAGSLEHRLGSALSLVAEIVSALGPRRAPNSAIARFGMVHALTPRIKLDGAIGVGVTRPSPELLLTLGVTIALY